MLRTSWYKHQPFSSQKKDIFSGLSETDCFWLLLQAPPVTLGTSCCAFSTCSALSAAAFSPNSSLSDPKPLIQLLPLSIWGKARMPDEPHGRQNHWMFLPSFGHPCAYGELLKCWIWEEKLCHMDSFTPQVVFPLCSLKASLVLLTESISVLALQRTWTRQWGGSGTWCRQQWSLWR